MRDAALDRIERRHAAQLAQGAMRAFRSGGLTVITGVSGSGKSTLARDVLSRNLERLLGAATAAGAAARATPPLGMRIGCDRLAESSRSAACSRSIRRRSARLRAPARPPTSDSGTRSAGSTPTPPTRASAASPPAASPSTPPAGAARPARARACRRIEMSFLPDVQGAVRRVRRPALQSGDPRSLVSRARASATCSRMYVDDAVEFFAAQRACTTRSSSCRTWASGT